VRHGLNVVAVGIKQEGSIVAGVVIALTRSSVVTPACCETGGVEALNDLVVLRLERQVDTSGQRLTARDEELIGEEVALSGIDNRDADHVQHRSVEAPACLDVAYDQVDVIDEPATMELHVLSFSVRVR
jgi:hypothetical protein